MVETGQAIIDEQGHRLCFEDTGEPSNGGIYTTLVLVHGTAFHSGRASVLPRIFFPAN